MADRTAFTVAGPPWTWSSRTSSPVTVLGEGKERTRALESTMFEAAVPGSNSVLTAA